MSEFVGKMQAGLKKTSSDILLFSVKLVSGAILGLTFGLIMQEILGKADNENLFGFLFVVVVTTGAFLRISKAWGFTAVMIFDLVCVLLGICLRLYIMVAPGA
jgi:hypothetical protein